MKSLYIISDGTISECSVFAQWDGESSVLAYADSPDQARVLASLYDDGAIQPDNITVDGVTISAIKAD